MAKVFAPALSLSASGNLASTVNFLCGKYVRKIRTNTDFVYSQARSDNQTKWSDGCKWWQTLGDDKKLWDYLTKIIKSDSSCEAAWNTPISGFKSFMIFFMEYGANGWVNFPRPPDWFVWF